MKTHEAIPKDWPVQPVTTKGEDIATDGYCGLSWDDGKVTSMTPAPSARCPFEPFHVYSDEPEDETVAEALERTSVMPPHAPSREFFAGWSARGQAIADGSDYR